MFSSLFHFVQYADALIFNWRHKVPSLCQVFIEVILYSITLCQTCIDLHVYDNKA
jgi:hypothetical protein